MTDRDYYDDSENDVDDRLERLADGEVLFLDRPSKHYIMAVWLDPVFDDKYRVQYVTPTLNDSQLGGTGTVSDIRGLLGDFPETDPPDDVPQDIFPPKGAPKGSTIELGTYDARNGGSV